MIDIFQEDFVHMSRDEFPVDEIVDDDSKQKVLDVPSAAGPRIHEKAHDVVGEIEREFNQSLYYPVTRRLCGFVQVVSSPPREGELRRKDWVLSVVGIGLGWQTSELPVERLRTPPPPPVKRRR